jgi:hypothetical protein
METYRANALGVIKASLQCHSNAIAQTYRQHHGITE